MRVGFVGVGVMGAPIARNILKGGFSLTVHDVDRADCGECLRQIGVQIHAVDGRRIHDDSRVDGRDKLHSALVGEPGDPFGVDLPIPADADQNEAGCRGGDGSHPWTRSNQLQ